MDPDLSFYCHTSTRIQFYEGVLPGFDKKPNKKSQQKPIPKSQQKPIPKYKLLGTNDRITMAFCGAI